MRPLLHLLSVLLVLPGLIFGVAFIVLGRAIAAQSLAGVLAHLLADVVWLIPWGLLAGCIVVALIALGGFFARTRWLAGLCVAVLGTVSTAILLVLNVGHTNFAVDQLPFLLLGVVAATIGFWFLLSEHSRAS